MIRKMEISDIDRVYDIENQVFRDKWSKKQITKILDENSNFLNKVYEKDNVVYGYIITSHILDEAEILKIAVDESYKGNGIASLIMKEFINEITINGIKKIFLEVSTKNTAAINLYKKFGFEIIGTRKNYYKDLSEDAYNMVRINNE